MLQTTFFLFLALSQVLSTIHVGLLRKNKGAWNLLKGKYNKLPEFKGDKNAECSSKLENAREALERGGVKLAEGYTLDCFGVYVMFTDDQPVANMADQVWVPVPPYKDVKDYKAKFHADKLFFKAMYQAIGSRDYLRLPLVTPPGIPNVGRTCHVNSALQLLFHVPELADGVMMNTAVKEDWSDDPYAKNKAPSESLMALIATIFESLQTNKAPNSDTMVDLMEELILYGKLGKVYLEEIKEYVYSDQDVSETLEFFYSMISEVYEEASYLFGIHLERMDVGRGFSEKAKQEAHFVWRLPAPKGPTSIEALFKQSIAPLHITDTLTQLVEIKSVSQYIILQVERVLEGKGDARTYDNVTFPVNGWSLPDPEHKGDLVTYDLYALALHTINPLHYRPVIRNKEGKWHLYDDSAVNRIDIDGPATKATLEKNATLFIYRRRD